MNYGLERNFGEKKFIPLNKYSNQFLGYLFKFQSENKYI